MEDCKGEYLRTCEVYNILTDEWHFIAGKTLRRTFGSMVLVDQTLYVLGGNPKATPCACFTKGYRDKVECYDPESDEWNVNATVPVNRMTSEKAVMPGYVVFQGCSLRVFKGLLTKLESIAGIH